jgi:catechol 2,3-dioxygenase-like lactoylglutathione lyase family enzyme
MRAITLTPRTPASLPARTGNHARVAAGLAGNRRRRQHGRVFRDPQVNSYVTDIEAAERFYRDLLGFAETFRTPDHGPPVHVELRLGQFTLGLATIETLRETHGVAAGPGAPRAEIVLWTDDVDAAVTALSAKGVQVLSLPHDFATSLRAAWVCDPEGNPVQIVMRREEAPAR